MPKGFIAVDGTSLTVVGVYEEESSFDFMLVAYTQQKIVLPSKKVGDKVNLEVDILGKYVEKLLSGRLQALGVGPVTSSWLSTMMFAFELFFVLLFGYFIVIQGSERQQHLPVLDN